MFQLLGRRQCDEWSGWLVRGVGAVEGLLARHAGGVLGVEEVADGGVERRAGVGSEFRGSRHEALAAIEEDRAVVELVGA